MTATEVNKSNSSLTWYNENQFNKAFVSTDGRTFDEISRDNFLLLLKTNNSGTIFKNWVSRTTRGQGSAVNVWKLSSETIDSLKQKGEIKDIPIAVTGWKKYKEPEEGPDFNFINTENSVRSEIRKKFIAENTVIDESKIISQPSEEDVERHTRKVMQNDYKGLRKDPETGEVSQYYSPEFEKKLEQNGRENYEEKKELKEIEPGWTSHANIGKDYKFKGSFVAGKQSLEFAKLFQNYQGWKIDSLVELYMKEDPHLSKDAAIEKAKPVVDKNFVGERMEDDRAVWAISPKSLTDPLLQKEIRKIGPSRRFAGLQL